MIKLKNVSKRFGSTVAVEKLSLNIGQGQVVGFLGPNGAGKSTTMRMITGYLVPDGGEITIDGRDVALDSGFTKTMIGYLPENNPLYEEMIVRDYLVFTARVRDVAEVGESIREAVKLTGIDKVFYRPIGELSKGYRQRVGLAAAILHEPKILILDEPTEGLDPNQRVEIRKLIKEIGRRKTVVLSTHVLQEVGSTCDRVIIIDNGKLVADSAIESLMSQAQGVRRVVVELSGAKVAAGLKKVEGALSVEKQPGGAKGRHRYLVTGALEDEIRPKIFSAVKENDWLLWEMYQEEISLEDVFRNLTIGHEDEHDN